MIEITAEIRALIDKAAAGVELAGDEYIDPSDGLIHCKKCGGQRQTVVPCFGKSGYFISYSLLCRWFKVAVLPLDAALCAEITKGRDEIKRCAVCGAAFTPNSNRAKYCPDCAVQVRRKKEAERQRKRYLLSTHLGR